MIREVNDMADTNKKANDKELTPQYHVLCGDRKRKCCSQNPDCSTEIQVLPDGTINKTGLCCHYYN